MNIALTKELELIFKKFAKNNYEVYLVGGCVRDLLLERKVNDYDLTTNALPQDIKRIFNRYKTIDTGIMHGTVSVIINKKQFEITTFRSENKYSDHRHPDDVVFTPNLKDDLARRDFTINALAYSLKTGLIDYYDGLRDLYDGIIKAVGDPYQRFDEDGLRILRALRFASSLNFTIEENTSNALRAKKDILSYVSKERITSEFSKLLMSQWAYMVLAKYRDIFDYFIVGENEINSLSYRNCIEVLTKTSDKLSIRLAIYMLHNKQFKQALDDLKLPTRLKNEVCFLIEHQYDIIDINQISIKHYLHQYSRDYLLKLIDMQLALSFINESGKIRLLALIDKVITEKQCYSLDKLAINGNDLKELGYQGIQIKTLLNETLKKVIDEQLPNDYELLIESLRTN